VRGEILTEATKTDAGPQRKKRQTRTAIVSRKEWLNSDMVRLFFTGPDLEQLPELTFTDHYVKLLFAPEGADYSWPFDADALRETLPREQWPVTRTYTIRSFDRDRNELAIDFVVHGDSGLAGPWAAHAEAGAQLGFNGPGGAYAPEDGYDHHLLVGDEAAIPAIAAALDQLPGDAAATAVLEVADPEHHQPVATDERIEIVWVHRGGRPYGQPLAETVRDRGLPAGKLQVFVHGNAEMVRDLRKFFFVENRLDRKDVSISGYWRTGQTEDGWQSGKREFVARMEAEEAQALAG
jgi:NADPH-dependent ferric siderophore reductase